jgi:hypothetical protein
MVVWFLYRILRWLKHLRDRHRLHHLQRTMKEELRRVGRFSTAHGVKGGVYSAVPVMDKADGQMSDC